MAVRMIQYDFSIAVEGAVRNGREYMIKFPRSCVLYIRSFSTLPHELNVHELFPDGTEHTYHVPVVQAAELESDPEKLMELLREYDHIQKRLQSELLDDYSGLYSDLIELIIKISDYIFRDAEKVKKGIGDVMGGKILELTSEKLLAEGVEKGEDRLSFLINGLIADGRNDEISRVCSDKAYRERLYKEYGL